MAYTGSGVVSGASAGYLATSNRSVAPRPLMLSRSASTLAALSQNFFASGGSSEPPGLHDTYVCSAGDSGSSPSGTSAPSPRGMSATRRRSFPPVTTAGSRPGSAAPSAQTNGYASTSSYALSDGGVSAISAGARVKISPRAASSAATNGADAVTENATAAVSSRGFVGSGSGASAPSSTGSATGKGTGSSLRSEGSAEFASSSSPFSLFGRSSPASRGGSRDPTRSAPVVNGARSNTHRASVVSPSTTVKTAGSSASASMSAAPGARSNDRSKSNVYDPSSFASTGASEHSIGSDSPGNVTRTTAGSDGVGGGGSSSPSVASGASGLGTRGVTACGGGCVARRRVGIRDTAFRSASASRVFAAAIRKRARRAGASAFAAEARGDDRGGGGEGAKNGVSSRTERCAGSRRHARSPSARDVP